MSYAEIFNETRPKAKKPHTCNGCLKKIQAGEKYYRISGKWDGDFSSYAYHTECREWEEHLNAGAYPDEWYLLHEHVSESRDSLIGAPESVIQKFSKRSGE